MILRGRPLVLIATALCAIGVVAGGDLAAGAPSGAQLVLTGMSPLAGPFVGGNEVTIRANDAADITSVDFGAATSADITHITANLLIVVAPAHDVGSVDVVVHTASATSPVTPLGRYDYVPPPKRFDVQWGPRLGSRLGVGALDAIGCTTRDFCAVEVRNRKGHVTALATFGAGHRPRVQPLPDKPVISHTRCYKNVPTACWQTFSSLVACGTPRFCVAGNRRYLRTWDGRRWSEPKRVNRRGDALLSCAPGTALCMLGGRDNTYVHDRHGWRTVRYQHGFDHPTSLSCATAHFCLAVANNRAARFDGTKWHAAAARPHLPTNVGCASARYCLAAGASKALVFDGSGWHALPRPPVRAAVRAVSCPAVGQCTAATKASAETFRGGKWTKARTISHRLDFGPSAPMQVTGFSCVPHGICRATVGRGQTLRLASGQWTHTENITPYHDLLSDISCASATWCMAVGRSGEAFRYSGGQWTREGYVDGRFPLAAISCTSNRVCMAVDASKGRQTSGPLAGGRAVRYAHGSWQRPVVIDTGQQLTDVSCATDNHCVAIEQKGRAPTYRNGKWSGAVSLKPGRDQNGSHFTESIDCPTIHYCATAGYPRSQELVDGSWRTMSSGLNKVRVRLAFSDASGVDCVDPDYCVFSDSYGILIRNHGVLGYGYDSCCQGGRAVSCASRTYCSAVFTTEGHDFNFTHTYLLNGGAVLREGRLSKTHLNPWAIACFAGPVCVGINGVRGFVGTA